jgi:TonB family protein
MKRTVAFFACTLMLVLTGVNAQTASQPSKINSPNVILADASSWQRYTVKGEQFSITLPTLPAMATNRLSTIGYRERWERELGAYAGGVVYTIYSLDDGHPNEALKASIKQISSSPAWDRGTEQSLTQNGFAGKQYSSTNPLGGTVRVFATKERFYRFQAFGATAEDANVKQFFSSLLLGKKNEGTEVSDGPGVPFGPADQASETVFTGKEVDRKILLIMKPEPSYTDAARQNQITGTVVLRSVFSSNGNVTDIRVRSGLPAGLTEKAIGAARKIRFVPAVKDGKFVSVFMQLEYNFNLY